MGVVGYYTQTGEYIFTRIGLLAKNPIRSAIKMFKKKLPHNFIH